MNDGSMWILIGPLVSVLFWAGFAVWVVRLSRRLLRDLENAIQPPPDGPGPGVVSAEPPELADAA